MVKAVLFDLDDTVFDHKFSRLKGLEALQEKFPNLKEVPLPRLEQEHEALLRSNYGQVLDGKLSIADAIIQRISVLCLMHDVNLDLDQAQATADLYNQVYAANRQAVPGVKNLLETLKRTVKVGVVSNGFVKTQMEKLQACELEKIWDLTIFSEAVGHQKPGKEIFQKALEEAESLPSEAVYVGNSWETDILPAVSVGMKAVWLNRYGLKCPDTTVAKEIPSFENVDVNLFL